MQHLLPQSRARHLARWDAAVADVDGNAAAVAAEIAAVANLAAVAA